jgi:ribonuclease T2
MSATLFYVLAYTFQPEYCRTHGGQGCSQMNEYWVDHFTLHGLWPQYTTGGYPTDCSTEPFSFQATDQMYFYWPNINKIPGDPEYDSFWIHEWDKHGTCSLYSQPEYFQHALDLIQWMETPDLFVEAKTNATINNYINATDLRTAFSSCALECNNGEYISGVYTCWSTELNQIECPAEIIKEDTCVHPNVIKS